jgi:hypothetical protein
MWWLTFRDGSVVILQASSLLHARMLAVKYSLGRPAYFAEGHFIDPERAALIPHDDIRRMLSPPEARQVHDMLRDRRRRNGADTDDVIALRKLVAELTTDRQR